MNIIGIAGKAQAGKNLTASIIQKLTSPHYNDVDIDWNNLSKYNFTNSEWEQKCFADKLKDIVCILIGCTRKQLEDGAFKETELGEEWWIYDVNEFQQPYEEGDCEPIPVIKLTPRKLLQTIGTDLFRNRLHPDIWCNSLFSDYNEDTEKWIDVVNYEGSYQISSFGRIKSLDRKIVYGEGIGQYHTKKSQFLKPTLSGGYETVSLSGKTFTLHSLVAKHFVKGYQEGFVVNHIDYNKTNNFYKNLEWITQEDNIKHNKTTLRGNFGESQKDAKLDSDKVLAIKKLIEYNTLSQNKIAKLFNVSPTTISGIKKGKKWNHVGKDIDKIEPILPVFAPKWIITDVRFPNECKKIKEKGGIIINVVRNHSINKNEHVSERMLDGYSFDYQINNFGTIEELVENVKEILIKEKILQE